MTNPVTDDSLIGGYVERLRMGRVSPSVEALHRTHRAQVERVTYETIWINMDQHWTVDREASMRRIVQQSRGGYCLHLNGALSLALEALGYETSLHIGGVEGPDGPTDAVVDNHLVLIVHGLPSDANLAVDWYVDAGLGDALHEPLPLVENLSSGQGPFTYALTRSEGIADWQFRHDPSSFFRRPTRHDPELQSRMVRRPARDVRSDIGRRVCG
jgi:N-hydroxyarylamine O-acetyltransferase